jgi:glucose/arabinose dehydrogenase
MKRWLLLLLVLPAVACGGLNTPPPPTPTVVSPSQTSISPTEISVSPTSAPTQVSTTDTALAPGTSGFPDPNAFTWKQIASGLQRPTDLEPNGSGRLFILEKSGSIRIFQNGQLLDAPFLDITDRVNSSGNEQGLLGLVFHPNSAQNGYFYVNYTGSNGDTFISRFQANGDSADPNSELNLLHIPQPYANHNGGTLHFGPDGYLYAGLGDGGSQGDPNGNGQNTKALLGKILRIDVNSGQLYAIPADNPFGNEVWAYGLRNPWRISFDKKTSDLYIADVGQNEWEEVDFVPSGQGAGWNFGWNVYEGNHDYKNNGQTGNFVFPVVEYNHSVGGCSITGGYVYRGSMPEWNGIYLYGDYCTGYVWGLIQVNGQWQNKMLFGANIRITSFGQDDAGEIYMLSDGGEVYQLVRK